MSSKHSGLTLVEVLIALIVVATAVLIVTYIAGAMRDMRAGQNMTSAMNFARTYLDTARALWSQKATCENPPGSGNKYICTQYASAGSSLPVMSAPANLKYAVAVNVLTGASTLGGLVVSCPKASICVPVAGSGDVNAPQRRITVTVTDSDNRDTVLAMNITRIDIP